MAHQPRRRSARSAGVVLGIVMLVGLLAGRGPTATGPLPTARAATGQSAADSTTLDSRVAPILVALNRDRGATELVPLEFDLELADGAARDACAIAHGDVPLSGDQARMAASGAARENVGMVIDDDPAAAAHAMHEWWANTRRHRHDRMDPAMTRYGVGACTVDDRTYYVERFAP